MHHGQSAAPHSAPRRKNPSPRRPSPATSSSPPQTATSTRSPRPAPWPPYGAGTRSFRSVPTHVVMPRGAVPVVQRFLAYHKHVLPVRGFKTIDGSDIEALGVVDASSAARLGRSKRWLSLAQSLRLRPPRRGRGRGVRVARFTCDRRGWSNPLVAPTTSDSGATAGRRRDAVRARGDFIRA